MRVAWILAILLSSLGLYLIVYAYTRPLTRSRHEATEWVGPVIILAVGLVIFLAGVAGFLVLLYGWLATVCPRRIKGVDRTNWSEAPPRSSGRPPPDSLAEPRSELGLGGDEPAADGGDCLPPPRRRRADPRYAASVDVDVLCEPCSREGNRSLLARMTTTNGGRTFAPEPPCRREAVVERLDSVAATQTARSGPADRGATPHDALSRTTSNQTFAAWRAGQSARASLPSLPNPRIGHGGSAATPRSKGSARPVDFLGSRVAPSSAGARSMGPSRGGIWTLEPKPAVVSPHSRLATALLIQQALRVAPTAGSVGHPSVRDGGKCSLALTAVCAQMRPTRRVRTSPLALVGECQ